MRLDAVTMLATTHESALDDARVALDSAKNDIENFFCISSRNRVVGDRLAIGIARIAPKAIRMHIAPCGHDDEQARAKTGADAFIERRFDG